MDVPVSLIRNELLDLLQSKNAHMSYDEAVADFPMDRINSVTPSTPYSAWHFIEHIRIAQWDILEFIRNPRHVSPDYPEGYRPPIGAEADRTMWRRSIESFKRDLSALQDLVLDPQVDLFAPIPHAPDYTIFREILLTADHNAYHIGELALLRQELNAWPKTRPYYTG